MVSASSVRSLPHPARRSVKSVMEKVGIHIPQRGHRMVNLVKYVASTIKGFGCLVNTTVMLVSCVVWQDVDLQSQMMEQE